MDQPVLGDSRAQQADVAGALADRAFDALGILLRGFEDAALRDGTGALDGAFAHGPEHLHSGLLTAILRLVFLLHAEDRGLLPASERHRVSQIVRSSALSFSNSARPCRPTTAPIRSSPVPSHRNRVCPRWWRC